MPATLTRFEQGPDDRQIRRRKTRRIHRLGPEPIDRLAILVRGLTRVSADRPDLEPHTAIRVGVFDIDEGRCIRHVYPKFLLELATQSLLHGLARMDLAAGKLPEPTLVQMRVSAAHQHLAARVQDHAHGDTQRGGQSLRAQLRYSALMRT